MLKLLSWRLRTEDRERARSSRTEASFREAAMTWLESRRPYISPRTFTDYQHYVRTLSVHFGNIKLWEISSEMLEAYLRIRMATAGASLLNHECRTVLQILERAGCSQGISFEPLPLPRESPGRALTEHEEEQLFRAAASKPEWQVAYWTAILSANTTAGPGEICGLRLMDLELVEGKPPEESSINVRHAVKNEFRVRRIPLNELAHWAAKQLLDRTRRLGASKPAHYLIPFRPRTGTFDVSRSGGWPRSAWRSMCRAAGLELRPYDLRHHAITKLLENPEISEHTAMAIAGHISPKMLRRYSHARMAAKRTAVRALIPTHVHRVPQENALDSHPAARYVTASHENQRQRKER